MRGPEGTLRASSRFFSRVKEEQGDSPRVSERAKISSMASAAETFALQLRRIVFGVGLLSVTSSESLEECDLTVVGAPLSKWTSII